MKEFVTIKNITGIGIRDGVHSFRVQKRLETKPRWLCRQRVVVVDALSSFSEFSENEGYQPKLSSEWQRIEHPVDIVVYSGATRRRLPLPSGTDVIRSKLGSSQAPGQIAIRYSGFEARIVRNLGKKALQIITQQE